MSSPAPANAEESVGEGHKRGWQRGPTFVGRRETSNFFALVTAQIIVAFVGLASTRFLTPSDKGLFTGVYLWALVSQTIVGLSLPNALLFFGVAERLSRPSRRLMSALGLGAFGCGCVLAIFVASHSPGHLALELIVTLLPAAMFSFEVSTYSVLAEGGSFYVYRLAQAGAFALIGIPALLLSHSATLLAAALLSSYMLCVIADIALRRPDDAARLRRLDANRLLRWSFKSHAGLTLSLLATRLDILFVTLFLSTASAGLYTAAAAFPNMLAFSGTALGLSLARRTTANTRTGRLPSFAWWWTAALLLSATTLAVLLIDVRFQLITGLFGRPYTPAVPLVVPLAISLPFWSLAAYQAQLLVAIGRPINQTIGQGVAAIVLATGSAIGVANGNLPFVAWSNVAAYLCSVLWQSTVLARTSSRPERL